MGKYSPLPGPILGQYRHLFDVLDSATVRRKLVVYDNYFLKKSYMGRTGKKIAQITVFSKKPKSLKPLLGLVSGGEGGIRTLDRS